MPGRVAETAKMVAELDLKTAKFTKGASDAIGSVGKLTSAVAKSRAVAVGVGVGLERLAEKGISVLSDSIATGIQGALTLEKAQAQTQAVIESTGHAAGITAQQVRDLANSTEDLTTVDDKTVQQAENLLLTFTNIGGNIFPQATKAVTDMAIAFNKGDASTADLDKAAIQLGKALNDPAAGFTALKKSGVSFSAAQIAILKNTDKLDKAQTKNYNTLLKTDKKAAERYKTGILTSKQLASQKLILAELEKEFGKAGTAANTGFAADVAHARDAIEDAQIAIAQGLLPGLGQVARELATTFRDPQVMQGLKDLGTGIGDVLKGGVAFAKTVPWGAIASSLRTAAGFAKDLLNAFLGLPTWVQTAVITGWGLNKLTGGFLTDIVGSLASGLIKGVLGITAGVVQVNAASVTGLGGAAGAAEAGGAGLVASAAVLAAGVLGVLGLTAAGQAGAEQVNTERGTNFRMPAGFLDFPTILSNLQEAINVFNNNTPKGTEGDIGGKIDSLGDRFHSDTVDIGGHIDSLGARFPVTPQAAKTPKVADAILAAGAARDKETSDAIGLIVKQQATSNDIEALRGKIAEGLSGLDTSTVMAGHNTSIAATQAGMAAARQTFASGVGIEQAINHIDVKPTVLVQISATDVTKVTVVEDRGGGRSGSRDGDGGGGPGQ